MAPERYKEKPEEEECAEMWAVAFQFYPVSLSNLVQKGGIREWTIWGGGGRFEGEAVLGSRELGCYCALLISFQKTSLSAKFTTETRCPSDRSSSNLSPIL